MTFQRMSSNQQLPTPTQVEQQPVELNARAVTVKQHTRKSSKGKVYRVGQSTRQITVAKRKSAISQALRKRGYNKQQIQRELRLRSRYLSNKQQFDSAMKGIKNAVSVKNSRSGNVNLKAPKVQSPRTMTYKDFTKKHGTPRRIATYKKEYQSVMEQFAKGKLRHGSTKGPVVTRQDIGLAIAHSMAKRKAYRTLMKKLKIRIQGEAQKLNLHLEANEVEFLASGLTLLPEAEAVAQIPDTLEFVKSLKQ
jgi:hypothetical protein